MLIFPLKKEWYERIKSGEKTIEYREVKPYWTKRLNKPFGDLFKYNGTRIPSYTVEFDRFLFPCLLRLGYTKKYMTANIVKIQIVDGKDTDLHIDKLVYAIHLTEVKEMENESHT